MNGSSSQPDSSGNLAHHDVVNHSTAQLLRGVLYLGLVVAVAVVAVVGYKALEDRSAMKKSQDEIVGWHGLVARTVKQLAPEYTDRSGRMVADSPADPQKLLNPNTIVVAHYQDSDKETQIVDWDEFRKFLSEVTGREIVLQEYQNSADEVAAIKQGKIQSWRCTPPTHPSS